MANTPAFISNSPSPVITAIFRWVAVRAIPNPMAIAPPIAPPSAIKLSASRVHAAASFAAPASPATKRYSSGFENSSGRRSRRLIMASRGFFIVKTLSRPVFFGSKLTRPRVRPQKLQRVPRLQHARVHPPVQLEYIQCP